MSEFEGMMLSNKIKELAKSHGCSTAYKLSKETGIPRTTAYRLWSRPDVYPSRESLEAICEAFDAQPGDFLEYGARCSVA